MRRIAAVLLLVLVACGSDDGGGGGGSAAGPAGEGEDGGEIVLAAEQWPECLNPITSCANSSWLHWTVLGHVLPRLMELTPDGDFVPSPLLAGEPELTEDPFTVSFTIADDAAWDDGSPITAADFEFTRRAYVDTPGSLTTNGYDLIGEIDTSEPKSVTLEFAEPFADWWDLFGGNQGYVLKADAFEGPTVEDDLLDEIAFSGGPFRLESWSTEEAVLVRNDAYWEEERVPLLDRVTVIPREDQNTEINSLLSGESAAIYPQPSPGLTQQLDTGSIQYVTGAGTQFEGLWFNQSAPPLDDPAVREALGHAIDRQAIVDTIASQIVEGVEVLNCAGWVPTVGDWCDDTDFADLTYDPAEARRILEAAGWTEGGDGIYAKGGQRLDIPWMTVSGNKRREDTQQLVIEQARAAGITFTVDNSDPGDMIENRLPQLDFTMGEYAQVASPDPAVTAIYGCDQIPSEANGFGGQNFTAWCNEEATALSTTADRTVDVDERLDLVRRLGDLVRQDVVWLPLYQLPLITAWDSEKVAGPVGEATTSAYGGFANLYDWHLP